jgi:hypothetical protein
MVLRTRTSIFPALFSLSWRYMNVAKFHFILLWNKLHWIMVLQYFAHRTKVFCVSILVKFNPFKEEKLSSSYRKLNTCRLGYNKTGYKRITCQWGELMERLLQWRSSNYYKVWVCVFNLRYTACNKHTPYCHVSCPAVQDFFNITS